MSHPMGKPASIPAVCALFAIMAPAVAHAQASSAAMTPAQPAMPLLEAKFEKNLDSKSAKIGDPVSAKTLKTYKLPDGSTLPKGSKLIAKVVTVQSKKQGNGTSMLTFRFDEAQLSGGETVPIHGEVVAIGPSLAPKDGLGPYSVMSRSQNASGDTSNAARGYGTTQGLDPNAGMDKQGARDEYDIPMGSTLEGVALGIHKDADWTTALEGVKTDVRLDSEVVIKVQIK
jgi:hypothetical protein